MSQQKRNLYEGMYVISATLSDDQRQKILDRIKGDIESSGGEIVKLHDQGRKRLAYEIDGQKEGYYFLVYFQIDPSIIARLWREYHLIEGLLRFMNIRTDTVMEKIEFKPLVEQQ